jgi:hypothetical protein
VPSPRGIRFGADEVDLELGQAFGHHVGERPINETPNAAQVTVRSTDARSTRSEAISP